MDSQLIGVVLLLLVLGVLARTLYWRVPANTGYIRAGIGKKQVLIDGGGIVIPGVHKVSEMDLSNFSFNIVAIRENSLLTNDPLRVDVEVRLLARINPDSESILIAQKLFDGEVDNVREVLNERCHSILRSVASEFSLENLLCQSTDFELHVNAALSAGLSELGLDLVLCSLVRIEQTTQLAYQRNNSIDAKALTLLEVMRSENEQKVHATFREADLQMKQLDYEAAMKQLEWEKLFVAAKLEHERHKAEIEARLTLEIKEIEVSKQVAFEMIEQDAQIARLQQQAA